MKTSRTLKTVAAAALALSGGVASAQSLPEPLVKAAQQAIVSNPEVQARWRAFTAASAERDSVSAGYRPQVDLTAGASHEQLKHPVPGLIPDWYTGTAGQLLLNQMLFDGLFTRNEVRRMGYAKLTRYYELLEASENIALEALKAYADVARYTELVEEAKSNYAEHKQTSRQIEERAASGVGRRVDLDQANGRLALAESNLLTEISNLHDVSARYLRIMGERPPIRMPSLPEGIRLKGLPASAAETMRQGLAASPVINAAYENVRSNRWNVESRQSAYWPRVDFRIRESWGRNANGIERLNGNRAAELLLNYNLYRGGHDAALEKQAVELQYQARDLQEKACRDTRQTLAIAYNDVAKLAEQMGYLDTHRLSIDKAMSAYRQQFDIGQRTLLDLLDTQNELFEANRAFIKARYDWLIAQARTLAAMGRLGAAMGVARPDQPSAQDAGQDRDELLPPEELCPFALPELAEVDKSRLGNEPIAKPTPPALKPVPPPITYPAEALFDFDKSVLKPQGKQNLDELIAKIRGVDVEVVVIVGHTDWIGTDEYNYRLSLRRAASVQAYLVSQGIPVAKVRSEGRGESEPVADNHSDEGRAKNRRVEITVVPVGYQAPEPAKAPARTPAR